ncbi:MAG: hypothetical protein LBR21_02565 [Propionibacteriaceae bacterium]|jgi:uncharacterized protein YkwD|nr:hypothetical protein [Propionibacteriaceae bacterium]
MVLLGKTAAVAVVAALAATGMAGVPSAQAHMPAQAKFSQVSKPKVSDTTPRVGQSVKAKIDKTTKPKYTKVTYTWLASGKKIGSKATLKVPAKAKGKKLSVRVCYSAKKVRTLCVSSKPTAKVAKAASKTSSSEAKSGKLSIKISGLSYVWPYSARVKKLYPELDSDEEGLTAKVTDKLTCWICVPVVQWLRDGKPIKGLDGEGERYWPSEADAGHEISAQVTVVDNGKKLTAVSNKISIKMTAPAVPFPADLNPSASQAFLEQTRAAFVRQLNEVRAQGFTCAYNGKHYGPVGPVTLEPRLNAAAQKYAQRLVDPSNIDPSTGYPIKTGHNLWGTTPGSRGAAEGYPGWVAENISAMGTSERDTPRTAEQLAHDALWQLLKAPDAHCDSQFWGEAGADVGIGAAMQETNIRLGTSDEKLVQWFTVVEDLGL